MDSELGSERGRLNSLESELIGRDGGDGTATRPLSYTRLFEEVCPYYMAMGMSYGMFWNGDCDAIKMYRKAHEIRIEQINFEAYLHGMYIYEALLDVTPVLSSRSKATQPQPYRSEPYDLHAAEKAHQEQKRIEEENKATERAKTMMELFMIQNNKKFKRNTPERKEVEHG